MRICILTLHFCRLVHASTFNLDILTHGSVFWSFVLAGLFFLIV